MILHPLNTTHQHQGTTQRLSSPPQLRAAVHRGAFPKATFSFLTEISYHLLPFLTKKKKKLFTLNFF